MKTKTVPTDILIRLENVTKKYHQFTALNNISFQIQPGEIFGYIGPNGAGKTTTIKILVGLIQQFSGDYYFSQQKMPGNIIRVQAQLGYLPQDVAFQDWRTVYHTLNIFGRLSGLPPARLEERIDKLLGLLELTSVKHQKVTQLSGGMRQKLGLAQAILHSPRLLVLDEPLAGLDPASRLLMKKIIKALAQHGTTIFFSSHILSDVQDIATKIAILNKGTLLKTGTIEELKSGFVQSLSLTVELFHPLPDLQILAGIDEIRRTEVLSPNKFLLHLEKGAQFEPVSLTILKRFVEQNLSIRSFQPVETKLDDVYLQYIQEIGRAHV